MFELLNRPSNYRTVNQQTEGALEDNSCCLRGGKCVWLIMWLLYVGVKEKWVRGRGRKGRFSHICSVPNTGSAQQWPIVGRNDNRLYLALQTARRMNAVSSLSFLLSSHLSLLHLSSLLILSAWLSFTDSSLLFSTPYFFVLFSLSPFVLLFSNRFFAITLLFRSKCLIIPSLFLPHTFSLIIIHLPVALHVFWIEW